MYTIKIKKDSTFCGKDAADVAFINGTAQVEDKWIADWFAARPDIYTVEKVEEPKVEKVEEPKAETAKKTK